MGADVDYERAYREAKRILTPGRGRGTVAGDTDNWRLARAQWHYDHGSRALAERELRDINEYRAARDWDTPGKFLPLALRRDSTPSDDSCRCNEQAREIGGEALRRVEAEQGRLDDSRRVRRLSAHDG